MFFIFMVISAVVRAGVAVPEPTIGFGGAMLPLNRGLPESLRYGYQPLQGYYTQRQPSIGISNGYVYGGLASPMYPITYSNPQANTFYPTTYRNSFIPEKLDWKNDQTNYDIADLISIIKTGTPASSLYHNTPYVQKIDTYHIFDTYSTTPFIQNKIDGECANKETDSSSESTDDSQGTVEGEDISSKTEPVLQLTHLGFVPQSLFRSASQLDDDAEQKIPFYILDYDEKPPASGRSSSDSPPVYVSPHRLRPVPRGNYDLPSDQPGYYLIDVQPVASDAVVGAASPTLFPMIQTLTGPMGGPISGLQGGLGANTQSKDRQLSYKPVYGSQALPGLNTFQSHVQSLPNQDGRGQQGFNSGFGTQTFGTREFEDNLVRHLITVRNKP